MTAAFMTDLETKDLDDGRRQLRVPLVYESEILGRRIEVPAGFVTDFASVPRVPIFYMLWGDRAHREAVVHDYLYQHHLVGKAKADRVFLEAMKARKKGFFVRWPMYIGVVLGGWTSYASGPDRFTLLNQPKSEEKR